MIGEGKEGETRKSKKKQKHRREIHRRERGGAVTKPTSTCTGGENRSEAARGWGSPRRWRAMACIDEVMNRVAGAACVRGRRVYGGARRASPGRSTSSITSGGAMGAAFCGRGTGLATFEHKNGWASSEHVQ